MQGLLAMLTDNIVLSSDGSVELTRVNGRVGALVRIGGKLESVFAFELAGGRIGAIYVVRNPDKLQHLGLPLRAKLLRTTLHRRTGAEAGNSLSG